MSYFEDDGNNAVKNIKRVDHRANYYGLYDKAAADVVRKKRNLKNTGSNLKKNIEIISKKIEEINEKIENEGIDSNSNSKHELLFEKEKLQKLKSRHEKRILEISELKGVQKDSITSAPIVRQVKREDSKRAAKEVKMRKIKKQIEKAEAKEIHKRLSDFTEPKLT